MDLAKAIVDLVRSSESRVALITPYTKLHRLDHLVRAVTAARGKGAKVTLVCRANEPILEDEAECLEKLAAAGVKIYEVENLHAKIYLSERAGILGSMNLVDYSFNNSIEIGALLAPGPELDQLREFVKNEIEPHQHPHPAVAGSGPVARVVGLVRGAFSREHGYCIRCGEGIELDPGKPYCPRDFKEWSRWGNENFTDSYCHACGSDWRATMRKPVCDDCYDRGF